MAKPSIGSAGRPTKRYPTIAACGLDCGLCPRFYTAGPSRCPGCAGPGFFEKHPTCAFITCCVKTRRLEVCAECPEFPCARVERATGQALANESSSYPAASRMLPNLIFIRDRGLAAFVRRQAARIRVLAVLLEDFDDGRSRSFFCRAAGAHEPEALRDAVKQARRAIEAARIEPADRKRRAAVLKAIIQAIPQAE